ncbi:uncharacterized protein LOC126856433 [Cataglyphis hispanica]|uniref:uncharacterized protein LOC126856433 n=1 Tax=Cataglyphis hispanica TaxID=1086592 RepID=UPI0021800661|nr:uncharacterized protein LOC126856433 [Cataglyphis hispanica]
MKKVPSKRILARVPRVHLPQKQYGFCCEEKSQDPEKRYNMRNPPFVSSLTNVFLNNGGPAVKFRVQDIGRSPFPIQLKLRILEAKGIASYLGRSKRCRRPLQWYLEDEIALAREFFAKKRQDNYNMIMKRNLMIARQKARERKRRIKRRNLRKITPTLKVTQDN